MAVDPEHVSKTCSVCGDGYVYGGRGMCTSHYEVWLRAKARPEYALAYRRPSWSVTVYRTNNPLA
jgi:hypothetical protein